MSYRPYFRHGIEQLQDLMTTSKGDLKSLKVIQYELEHRDRPKARKLKREVDDLVRRLSSGETPEAQQPALHPICPDTSRSAGYQQPPAKSEAVPARIAVECANCKTPNFVSTFEETVQHLSCSACKAPYEAQFKYGVMRTTFQAPPVLHSRSSPFKWIVAGIVLLIILALVIK